MSSIIYRVRAKERLHPADPLYVGNFYRQTARVHAKNMQDRQDLILYLANIHSAAIRSGIPLGMCRIQLRLMTLRDWVYDYKKVFDHFFKVIQTGYYVGDKFEISTVVPRKLDVGESRGCMSQHSLEYVPPALPKEGVVSKVFVQRHRKAEILHKLAVSGRLDLHAPVEWLLSMKTDEVNFYFSPSGKLQLRDTSTWPIAAIETWPAWLREELFGVGIDIESAYTQFLIEHVRASHVDQPNLVDKLYPDLLRSLEDKNQWRKEICCDILGLDLSDENISIVKKICMSLANGSKISPAILLGNFNHSEARDIIMQRAADTSVSNLASIGSRLSIIGKQYARARKTVCNTQLCLNPTRINQKLVFKSYFEWEREARYLIWEAIGRHGIMVHDGIDGVPEQYLQDIPGLVRSLNIRLT